jgi:WhiB family transcriptional regulator, redox-sensing transcriptional regulator
VSRPEGDGWLPVPGRPVVCRRGGCAEIATDPKVGLCPAHSQLLPRCGRRQARPETLRKGFKLPSWADHAACLNSAVDFFVGEGPKTREVVEQVELAKAVCVGCRVRRSCLEFGLYEQYGIWGGLTVQERKKLRRSRQEAA